MGMEPALSLHHYKCHVFATAVTAALCPPATRWWIISARPDPWASSGRQDSPTVSDWAAR